jgi:hypothetical protein
LCGQVQSNIIIDVCLTCPQKRALCRCKVRKQDKHVAWCVCVSLQKSCWTLSTCDVLRMRFAARVKCGNIYGQIFILHPAHFFLQTAQRCSSKRETRSGYMTSLRNAYINLGFAISIYVECMRCRHSWREYPMHKNNTPPQPSYIGLFKLVKISKQI